MISANLAQNRVRLIHGVDLYMSLYSMGYYGISRCPLKAGLFYFIIHVRLHRGINKKKFLCGQQDQLHYYLDGPANFEMVLTH